MPAGPEPSAPADAHAQLVDQLGLRRAATAFPDQVRAAADRGGRLLLPVPQGGTTEPACVFDPSLGSPAS